jgi:hypothetical protein
VNFNKAPKPACLTSLRPQNPQAAGSGQDPGRILRIELPVHNWQHVTAFGEETLAGAQRGPRMNGKIQSHLLSVIEHVVAHEVALDVRETVVRGETGKEASAWSRGWRSSIPRDRAQAVNRIIAGSDSPGSR